MSIPFFRARARPGVSLMEMALVVAVLGAVVGGGVAFLGPRAAQVRHAEAEARVIGAVERLTAHARIQTTLPCPDLDDDGLADGPPGACPATGTLPWVTLGASPAAGRDPWGRLLLYRVTPAATTPGALACDATWPDAPLALLPAPGAAPLPLLAGVLSLGANGALPPAPGSTEAANQDPNRPLSPYPAPDDPQAASFDDLVVAIPRSRLARAMGCPLAPPVAAQEVPTTADALSARATVTWTPRGTRGAVLDSGLTTLPLHGALAPTLAAEGGTLAVLANGAGLGVWSSAKAKTALAGETSGADITTAATGADRAVTLGWPIPQKALALRLKDMIRKRAVPASWLRQQDPLMTRCLTPLRADGSCLVDWIEQIRLDAWNGPLAVGTLILQACPNAPDEASARFSTLVFPGGPFSHVRLAALPVVDRQGNPVPGEASAATLEIAQPVDCAPPCKTSGALVLGCDSTP